MNAVKTAKTCEIPAEIEYVSVSELLAYPLNSKTHPEEQVETLKYSLTKFGQTAPLVIDRDGVLIAGHGRLAAMKALGYEKCAVIRVSEWTEEMAKEYRILDNRSNESPWNWENLKADLSTFESPMLDALFPDLDVPDLNLDDYKVADEGEGDGKETGNPDAVFVTVECVSPSDADRATQILRDAGFSLITRE